MEAPEVPGPGDDQLNPPSVTPEPAPADDQLVKMAAVGALLGAVVTLFAVRWFRRNLTITRRTG